MHRNWLLIITLMFYSSFGLAKKPELPSYAVSSFCNDNATHCVAVGQKPLGADCDIFPEPMCYTLISYVSNDNQETWQETTIPQLEYQTGQFKKVTCDSFGLSCLAIGSKYTALNYTKPIIYLTKDGGYTWQYIDDSLIDTQCDEPDGQTIAELYSVACDNNFKKCVAAGVCGTLLTPPTNLSIITKNSGFSWTVSKTLPPCDFVACKIESLVCDNHKCRAFGRGTNNYDWPNAKRTIFSSKDTGNTWHRSSCVTEAPCRTM